MSDLRERLDDLLADTPSYVGVPDAGAAWRAGGRRRARRRVAGAASVVVVAVVLGMAVGLLPRAGTVRPADDPGTGVDGYPTRVDDPWRLPDLPDAPGPVAGVLDLGSESRVVAADGRSWRVPQGSDLVDDFPPALSRDGRLLGYLDEGGVYVVHDLVSGERRTFAGVGDGRPADDGSVRWFAAAQSPSFWAPDGSAVLVRGGRMDDAGDVGALLFRSDGRVVELADHGVPIGWTGPAEIAWLGGPGNARRITLDVRDLGGRLVRQVDLPRVDWPDQWAASTSPDGDLVALRRDLTTSSRVTVVSARTGKVVDPGVVGSDERCLPSWRRGEVARLVHRDEEGDALVDSAGTAVVSVDPYLDVSCLTMAGDALDGAAQVRHGRPWLPVALVLLAGSGGLLLVRRRRARRRLSASAAPGSA